MKKQLFFHILLEFSYFLNVFKWKSYLLHRFKWGTMGKQENEKFHFLRGSCLLHIIYFKSYLSFDWIWNFLIFKVRRFPCNLLSVFHLWDETLLTWELWSAQTFEPVCYSSALQTTIYDTIIKMTTLLLLIVKQLHFMCSSWHMMKCCNYYTAYSNYICCWHKKNPKNKKQTGQNCNFLGFFSQLWDPIHGTKL